MTRWLGPCRLAWGILLLVAPGRAVRAMGGADLSRSRVVMRVLGGRHVVQGSLELHSSTGTSAGAGRQKSGGGLGAAVDAAHALTGLALAVSDPRWRRPALIDAGVATMFAGWGWRDRAAA